MKKLIYLTLIIAAFSSCNFKESLSLSNADDIVEIQKILDENFDGESEVYRLNLSGAHLSYALDDIHRVYKVNDSYFSDYYAVKDKNFSDPRKSVGNERKKAFKINSINLSIITDKYKEALDLLVENELLKPDEKLPITSWTFQTDRNGKVYSTFSLDYYLSTSTHGRVQTTTYDSFEFEVDTNNKLLFKK